ncbi:class II fructose-bisphosphate aldolase [Actinomadura flavalba]|uniref:class II fructose-bisphosphate aldolase n=1 Tax=Actinomadura flavalba TaxID=1120938 RepID=UPI000363007D|nr:class II fructose-bisphosphate aldolase [Actinomadura flavalba]
MPLVTTGALLAAHWAVGAFNAVQLDHLTAIIDGAARAGRPVVVQISENTVRYHGGVAPLLAAAVAAASAAPVPVAVHLDHVTSADLVRAAVELGAGSVMFDASTLPYGENVAATAEVAAWCHERGVWVEAELGEVGGKDGVHAPGARTRPAEAVAYVAATGVDALAVAVGTSHAMLTRDAVLDLGLIAALAADVPVPLVLHGSSGVPDRLLTAAVAAGMRKINIATQLNKVFTAAVRDALAADPALVDTRGYLRPARAAMAAEAARLLGVLADGEDARTAPGAKVREN